MAVYGLRCVEAASIVHEKLPVAALPVEPTRTAAAVTSPGSEAAAAVSGFAQPRRMTLFRPSVVLTPAAAAAAARPAGLSVSGPRVNPLFSHASVWALRVASSLLSWASVSAVVVNPTVPASYLRFISADAAAAIAASSPPSSLLAQPGFPLVVQQEGELAGYSHTDVPFHFTPHVPSSLRLHFQLTFTPLTAQQPPVAVPISPPSPSSAVTSDPAPSSSSSLFTFPLTLTCTAHELPLLLSDSILTLNTLIAGKLYRASLTIRNRSSSPHRFILRLPPALRGVVAFMPAVAVVQAGGAVEVGIRVRVKRGEEEQLLERVAAMLEEARTGVPQAQDTAVQESKQQEVRTAAEQEEGKRELRSQATAVASGSALPRVLRVPLSIEVTGQALPLQWTLTARLTSSLLSFSASVLSFPPTALRQSAAVPLTITNHSTLLQKLHIALPPFLSCLPSALLPLLPLRSFTVNIVFTPAAAVQHRGRILIRTKLGDEYALRAEARGLQPAVMLEAGASANSRQRRQQQRAQAAGRGGRRRGDSRLRAEERRRHRAGGGGLAARGRSGRHGGEEQRAELRHCEAAHIEAEGR